MCLLQQLTCLFPSHDQCRNLSYSVKSPIEYDKLVNPVNRLLHTSGLKNFADTEVTSKSTVAAGTSISSSSLALLDIISEERVDTIKNYDLVIDVDTQTFSPAKSKYLKLQNKKLANYIKCVSNRVIPIDNVNTQFSSNQGETELYSDIVDYNISDGYNRFLVQIVNPDNSERQTTEIITLPSPRS